MKLSDKLIITKIAEQALVMVRFSQGHAVEIRVAVLCGDKEDALAVGNIYVGKVKKLQKNIDAAFIEIADGQLCYYSIPDNPNPIYTKKHNSGKMTAGDELIVQIQRDSIKSKLPSVTSRLEFPGHFLVLSTQDNKVGVSSKLSVRDKKRLRSWVEPLVTEAYGFVVRTNAGEAAQEAIVQEAAVLGQQYQKLVEKAKYRTCFSMLRGPVSPWIEMVRDSYTGGPILNVTDIPESRSEMLECVVTDIPEVYESLREYLVSAQPEMIERLRLYQDDLLPLAKLYSLEAELDRALGERVWLKSGGYLVIQPTEALTVIDVNSGKYSGKKERRETLKKINLEAALEAARQIRLRNLSGIILIDFINMDNRKDERELLEYLKQRLSQDPVKTQLIDMTGLGLVEITRRKIHKTLREQMADVRQIEIGRK